MSTAEAKAEAEAEAGEGQDAASDGSLPLDASPLGPVLDPRLDPPLDPSPDQPPDPPRDPSSHREDCYRCFKPRVLCVCARIPRVANRTAIHIIQHPREKLHALGTARFAKLGLDRVSLTIPPRAAHHSLVVPEWPRGGLALLFPHARARLLGDLEEAERPDGLVILDGTWPHARALYRANPWLAELPHVALRPSTPSRYRIRREPRADCLSTIEAIVQALDILEPGTPGTAGLLEAFDSMIDEQIHNRRQRQPRFVERKQRRAREACEAKEKSEATEATKVTKATKATKAKKEEGA